MQRGFVIAALAGAIAIAAAPAAIAAPCTLTGVTLEDHSPSKDGTDLAKRRGATKNVGQEIRMETQLAGPRPPGDRVSFRWTVGGDAIRDYTDVTPIDVPYRPKGSTVTGTRATYAPVAFNVTAADRTDGSGNSVFDSVDGALRFYWRMTGDALPRANVPVTVQVLEQHAGDLAAHDCGGVTDTAQYTVERNKTDRESQPEDYYVEINHARRIFETHQYWHTLFAPDQPTYSGRDFLTFHRRYLAGYDAYRAEFGYGRKDVYQPLDGGSPIPAADGDGYTLAHVPRKRQSSDKFRPAWTRSGSTTAPEGVHPWCSVRYPTAPAVAKIQDFGTDIDYFGCQVEFAWHGGPHVDIGGDMGNPSTAHKDPIFWRWHGFVDAVYQNFINIAGVSARATLAARPAVAQRRGRRCLGLRPTVRGDRRANVLRGTRGRDVIAGRGGNDRIIGLGGDDVICGDAGHDRISGGAGDDWIIGETGADRVRGNSGSDSIEAGAGKDRVSGGPGPDYPSGGAGDDVLDGGNGGEWMILGGPGDDRIQGGAGNDHLHGGAGSDRLHGGRGMDGLVGEGGDDRMAGGGGHDHAIFVTAARGVDVDLMDGTATGAGSDRLHDVEGVLGSGFDDEIDGGHHGEELAGGLGDDDISGGHGDDTTHGGGGDDDCGGETETSC